MAQSKTTGGEGIVYLTRRAYESGEIRLLLRTDAVCAERDTGWQLLQGSETGLELSNPEKRAAGIRCQSTGTGTEADTASGGIFCPVQGGICL